MSETIPAQSSPPLIAAPTEPQVNFRLKTFKLYKLRKNRNQKKNLNNERFEGATENISTCHEEDEVGKPAEDEGAHNDPELGCGLLLPGQDLPPVLVPGLGLVPGPDVGQERPDPPTLEAPVLSLVINSVVTPRPNFID